MPASLLNPASGCSSSLDVDLCVCKVMVRGHRSDYDLSGLNVDDIVVMPCVNFGKNTQFF